MKNILKNFSLLLTIALLLIVSCSKDNSEEKPDSQETTFNLISNEKLPGELVEIISNNPIVEPEIELMIGDKTVKAYDSGNNSYIFIMPVMSSGSYDLKFSIDNQTKILTLKIKDYAIITNPEIVIDEFVTNRDKCFDAINAIGASPETLLMIEQIKEEWEIQYNKNSAEDKLLLAYMVQKNAPSLEWFNEPAKYSDSYYNKTTNSNIDSGQALITVAKEFLSAESICLTSIPLMVGAGTWLLSSPNYFSAAAFLATFTTFIITKEVAIYKARQVGSLNGIAEKITEDFNKNTALLEMVQDKDTDISMKINFRNLNSLDKNIQPDITQAFNEEIKFIEEDNNVKKMYDKAIKHTEKLKSLYAPHIAVIGKKPTQNMPLTILDKDIIVKGSSNSEVKITTRMDGEERKIIATSTSMKDIEFNLKLAYKRAVDDKEITLEIPCIYKPKISLVGSWKMETYNNGTPVGVYLPKYNQNCPTILNYKETVVSGSIVFTETGFNYSWKGNIIEPNIEYNSTTCEIQKDNPDTSTDDVDSGAGTYSITNGVPTLKYSGGDVETVQIISENRIKILDEEYVRN